MVITWAIVPLVKYPSVTWHQIAHSSACQWLSHWFTRRIAQRIAGDCSFFHSSTAFTVYAPFSSAAGRVFLILLLVIGFPDGLRTVLRSGYPRISHSSTGQWLSQFACRFAQWMAAYFSFFRSSMAFTVYAPFCFADDWGLLILPHVNGFHDGLRAVLFSGWWRIACFSSRQRLSRFALCFAQRMVAHCSFFHLLTAFTVCMQYCSPDGGELHILLHVNGFHYCDK